MCERVAESSYPRKLISFASGICFFICFYLHSTVIYNYLVVLFLPGIHCSQWILRPPDIHPAAPYPYTATRSIFFQYLPADNTRFESTMAPHQTPPRYTSDIRYRCNKSSAFPIFPLQCVNHVSDFLPHLLHIRWCLYIFPIIFHINDRDQTPPSNPPTFFIKCSACFFPSLRN